MSPFNASKLIERIMMSVLNGKLHYHGMIIVKLPPVGYEYSAQSIRDKYLYS